MRAWIAAGIVLPACGRLGFDATDPDAATPLVRCLEDTFADGDSVGWMPREGDWSVTLTPGLDGSPALRGGGFGAGHQVITHSAIAGITRARITLDYKIMDAGAGDFVVDLMATGWTVRQDPHYGVQLFPPGSDSTPDEIKWETPFAVRQLAFHEPSAAAGTWHRLVITFAADHAIDVVLDGAPYMASGADATVDGPFDIALHVFNDAFIDNVVIDCAR
ncbi:MAG: hypothetical protein H0T42_04490 [Deltaproteobacteria bacterium]|nr:hypothetical protein [Deltaproteobacteria bacterium]